MITYNFYRMRKLMLVFLTTFMKGEKGKNEEIQEITLHL